MFQRAMLLVAMLSVSIIATAKADLPAALFRDPPIDATYPASGAPVEFISHGSIINGRVYRPAGAAAHPTVILLHGLPGNEQNLDLVRVMQRSGWTVITFHYRGNWGTPGRFTLLNGVDDAQALFTKLQNSETARAWGVDSKRIVLAGHSYGGYIAARVAAAHVTALGIALIAPWDAAYDARAWAVLSAKKRERLGADLFGNINGRLSGATDASLMRDIIANGRSLDLTALAAALASRRVLI